jgi:hypothetical protein
MDTTTKTEVKTIVTERNGIKTELTYGGVFCTNVKASIFHEEISSAELRQNIEITTYLPKRRSGNNFNDTLFSNEELGIEETPAVIPSERVTFIDVPKGITPNQVNAMLQSKEEFSKVTLYRIYANHPHQILNDVEKAVIAAGKNTVEALTEKFIARYSKKHKDEDKRGKIAIQNNKPFYSRTCFSLEHKDDIDLRTSDPKDVTLHPKMIEELQKKPQSELNPV